MLAETHYFRQDLPAFRAAMERSIELNPNHPGWYYFNIFFNEYRSGRYREALDIASRINIPGYWGDGLARALSHGRLGNDDAAKAAVQDLLAVWPDFEESYYAHGLINWVWAQPDLVEDILIGLEAAGLEMVVRAPGDAGL